MGTLTLSSTLAITGAAGANNLYFDLGDNTGTSDQISVAGTTTVTTTGSAVVNLNQFNGLAGRNATTYTLIGGAGTLDATNFAKFSLATPKPSARPTCWPMAAPTATFKSLPPT